MAFQFSVGGVNIGGNNLNNNQNGFSGNQNAGRPVTSRAGWFIPLLIGLTFVALGAFMVYQSERSKDWPTASATVQSVDSVTERDSDGDTKTSYKATLEFTVDEKRFTTSMTSSSATQVGSTQEVRYNPENPNDTQIGDMGIFTYIFGGVGLILTLFSIFKIATFKKPGLQQSAMQPQQLNAVPIQQPAPLGAQPQQQPFTTVQQPFAPTPQPSQTPPAQQQQSPSTPPESNLPPNPGV